MKKRTNKFFRVLFIRIPILLILLSIVWVFALKWVPVYVTPLMVTRSLSHLSDESFHTYKKWKPLESISKEMVYAVIASEDTRFLDHKGFDVIEIRKAIDDSKNGKRLRGASTISQQTAKNVFLFPSRSWVRKALEAYFTVAIELVWGKERIMEVYLNVAEMGKGIYGAEAAAKQCFNKSAARLTMVEASLLAAVLPNPLKRNAGAPSAYVSSRAGQIRRVMGQIARPKWKSLEKK